MEENVEKKYKFRLKGVFLWDKCDLVRNGVTNFLRIRIFPSNFLQNIGLAMLQIIVFSTLKNEQKGYVQINMMLSW